MSQGPRDTGRKN